MAILTIVLSNLRKRKGSFISIFILVLIITMATTTILSTSISGKERFDISNKEANSPDIVNFIANDLYNPEMKNKVLKQDEVEDVEEIEVIQYDNLTIANKDINYMILIGSYDENKNVYKSESNNKKLKEPKEGEIYLPLVFKDLDNCKRGTNINLKTEKGDIIYKVADFFEDPVYGSEGIGIKRVFINENDFNKISEMKAKEFTTKIQFNTFIKDSYKEKDIDKTVYNINKNTELNSYGESSFTIEIFKEVTFMLTNIVSTIFLGFCSLLFLIVIIVIGHSINSNIEMDYVSLGIFKAIGFTNFEMRLILITQYTLISLLGAIIGVFFSLFLLKPIGRFLLTGTGLLFEGTIKATTVVSLISFLVIIIAAFTIIVTRKITKISPVRAIAFGHAPVYFSSRVSFPISKLNWIPLSIKISLKQITTHLKQYAMLFIVVGVLIFFTISIGTISKMINSDKVADFFGAFSSDILIENYDNNEEGKLIIDEITKYIDKESKITDIFKLQSSYNLVDDNKILVMVIDNVNVIKKQLLEGRNPKYSNEIIITQIVSKLLQKSVGDKVLVQNTKGNKDEYIIVGIYQNTYEMGQNILMLESGMQKLDSEFVLKRMEFKIENREKADSIVEKLQEKYESKDGSIKIVNTNKVEKESMSSIVDTVNIATTGVNIIAIGVVALISILVCSKTLQKEQIDIGILKAQGFKNSQLRSQFTIRFVIVSLLGSTIGILANMLTNDKIMSLIFKNIGITEYKTIYSVEALIQPVLIICTFTIFFAWLVTRKITKITPKNLIQE